MKLRKYEFRLVDILDEGPTGDNLIKTGVFDYYLTARDIINSAPSQQGLNTEEILVATELFGKFREARRNKEEFVWLSDEDYNLLSSRLTAFRWVKAHPVISEYVRYVRALAPQEVTISSGRS